jgi:hypothetical protein
MGADGILHNGVRWRLTLYFILLKGDNALLDISFLRSCPIHKVSIEFASEEIITPSQTNFFL